MGWMERYRERNAESRARIAQHPVAAWVVHSILFALFAVFLQRVRGAEVEWVPPLVIGPLVAAALVAGTVFAYRREQRRSQKP